MQRRCAGARAASHGTSHRAVNTAFPSARAAAWPTNCSSAAVLSRAAQLSLSWVSLGRRDVLAGSLSLGAAALLGCKDTAMTSSNRSGDGSAPTTAMPVLFVAHGAPPLLDDDGWIGELAAWGKALPRPRAIAVVSAHWEARPLAIGAVRPLPLIYDFYGFPERFYRLQYAAPGAPALAR